MRLKRVYGNPTWMSLKLRRAPQLLQCRCSLPTPGIWRRWMMTLVLRCLYWDPIITGNLEGRSGFTTRPSGRYPLGSRWTSEAKLNSGCLVSQKIWRWLSIKSSARRIRGISTTGLSSNPYSRSNRNASPRHVFGIPLISTRKMFC